MKKYLVCILMLASTLQIFAIDPTPLSKFSTQWNYDIYQKANTAAGLTYLSKEEKDFVFTINLARMNPWLFCKTVLSPYAEKNGYSTPLMIAIEQMKGTQHFDLIHVEVFFTEATRRWAQTENVKRFIGKEHPENLYLNDAYMKNAVLSFEDYKDPADLLCKMIADQNGRQHSIRNYLTGPFPYMGLSLMRNNNKNVVSVIFCDKTALAYTNPKGFEMAMKKGVKLEDMRISYYDFRNDSLMRYFVNDNESYFNYMGFVLEDTFNVYKDEIIRKRLELMNPVLVSESRFKVIYDSIVKKDIAYVNYSVDYGFELNPNKSINEQLYCVYKPDFNYMGSSTVTAHLFDQPVSFNYCCIKRTLAPNAFGKCVFTIETLKNIRMEPMFTSNEIGGPITIANKDAIDSFVVKVPKMPLKKLAHALTDKYKKPEEKIRSLFSWMQYHLDYDSEGLRNGKAVSDAEQAIQKGVAICAGYADLFQKFCEELKIPSRYLSGFADNGSVGLHAWNAVMIYDKWYLIDATWGQSYFLASPDYFIKDHFPGANRWTLMTEYYDLEKFLKGKKMDR